MAKKVTFEVYEGLTSRKKKYIVVPIGTYGKAFDDAVNAVMRINHCSITHVKVDYGYIFNGLLYIGGPTHKKVKLVSILSYRR